MTKGRKKNRQTPVSMDGNKLLVHIVSLKTTTKIFLNVIINFL